MPELFDVGVTSGQVLELLRASPVVSVVGFQGSGKSTVAELLHRHLPGTIVMQTASSWAPRAAESRETGGDMSVDPEVIDAMDDLQRAPGPSCWIVDDAEVMFAYATEPVLAGLGKRLRNGRFSLVLIRNRFVLEGEGWFHQRQSIISQNIPALTMRPVPGTPAVAMATAMFDGPSRDQQGAWLASMSGGVPGLMSDLQKYTPKWAPQAADERLLRFARRKRDELELEKPIRRLLVQALEQRVLPTPPLLSEQARRELGVLLVAGMVYSGYATTDDPFNGEFWRLISRLDEGEQISAVAIPNDLLDVAMNLELMLVETGLLKDVKEGCGIDGGEDGALTRVLAGSLYCERHFPMLIRPPALVLGEILGRFGVVQLLRSRGVVPPPGTSGAQLMDMLMDEASS